MNPEKTYPAKLLLFGEYTILLGSSALGMPIKAFTAFLSFINQQNGDLLLRAEQSNKLLGNLCNHYIEESAIFNKFLDLDCFKSDIAQGLFLSSIIPQRFGMGSSGALCAAIYGRYRHIENNPTAELNKEQLKHLREIFIKLESFFHGKSSGFDPLVIYLQKTMLIGKDGVVIPLSSNNLINDHKIEILLIDSGLPRSGMPLVQQFLDQYRPNGIISPAAERMISFTNSCIDKLISENIDRFWSELFQLSGYQLAEMSQLIPVNLQSYWSEGLKSSSFALKLCGSGGGGYFTCITPDKTGTMEYFRNKNVGVVEV